MRTAIRWKLRPAGADPTIELDAPRVARRERLLADPEVSALLAAAEAAEAEGMPAQVAGAIRMVLMSGWRAGEVLTLQRSFVDRARQEARLPDTKTGHSVRPLALGTLALLDALPRLAGSPYYFPAVKDPSEPLSHSTLAHAFRRLCKRQGSSMPALTLSATGRHRRCRRGAQRAHGHDVEWPQIDRPSGLRSCGAGAGGQRSRYRSEQDRGAGRGGGPRGRGGRRWQDRQ